MKTISKIAMLSMLALFLFATTSCVVLKTPPVKHDNGKHKGWYKNQNNPHNPSFSKDNGKGNGNGNGKKSKGNKKK